MKQLLILSGKGGTGKTTVAASFIALAEARAYGDCDVDAPNLHLVMAQQTEPGRREYYGLPKAVIDRGACAGCGLCAASCRFGAITRRQDGYQVDAFACEGCGLCERLCPQGAVTMAPAAAGELLLYQGETVFSTAKLRMGSGNSGKLVTEVKGQLTEHSQAQLVIIDGSPGIGCPVIASLSGADMVLLVAEPSVSGISDLQRIITTARMFQMKMAVCVNKYDINQANTDAIQQFCQEQAIPYVGGIPFDPQAVAAVNSGQPVVAVDCPAAEAIRAVFGQVMALL